MVARIILVGHIDGTGKFQVDGSDGEQSNTPYDDQSTGFLENDGIEWCFVVYTLP